MVVLHNNSGLTEHSRGTKSFIFNKLLLAAIVIMIYNAEPWLKAHVKIYYKCTDCIFE